MYVYIYIYCAIVTCMFNVVKINTHTQQQQKNE